MPQHDAATPPRFVPHVFDRRPEDEMRSDARAFYQRVNLRRTVRSFTSDPVPRDIIEQCLLAAGTAPSGAHQQPWHFVVVEDPAVKRRTRDGAEAEERAFYGGRAPDEWLAALAPIGTDERKPFLEIAPYLIVIFAQAYGIEPNGTRSKHYYVPESVGIATGLLIAALHHAGLASLTHTPSPMNFLNEILGRPANERPYLILVTGYPEPGVQVPELRRRSLEDLAEFR